MNDYFKDLNYIDYCLEHKLNELKGIEIDLEAYGDITEKRNKKWSTIDPSNQVPSAPELDDLIRLHYLVTTRKVRTVMEFGVGKSTYIFTDALKKNKVKYADYVKENLRISTPFELHSVENNAGWLSIVVDNVGNEEVFHPHLSPLSMGTFNDRICTYYDGIPNIRPDFIYLDGPDQFSAGGAVRGINTNHSDRMPMAADLLAIEHFLEPGTLILVDGRTANARFLKTNFQRDWKHVHLAEEDQHIFELVEEPLGKWNKQAMDFTYNRDAE